MWSKERFGVRGSECAENKESQDVGGWKVDLIELRASLGSDEDLRVCLDCFSRRSDRRQFKRCTAGDTINGNSVGDTSKDWFTSTPSTLHQHVSPLFSS